jgi:hypothetical protein
VDVAAGSTLVLYTDGLSSSAVRRWTSGWRPCAARSGPADAAGEGRDHVLDTLGRSEGAADDVALLVMSHLPDA